MADPERRLKKLILMLKAGLTIIYASKNSGMTRCHHCQREMVEARIQVGDRPCIDIRICDCRGELTYGQLESSSSLE